LRQRRLLPLRKLSLRLTLCLITLINRANRGSPTGFTIRRGSRRARTEMARMLQMLGSTHRAVMGQ
jgi:hypothetical protein